MTLREAYEYGQGELKLAGIEDAAVDAWYLLEFVTGISRAMYFLNMQEKMSGEQEEVYRSYIERRASHIPLQHITGVQEFMGLEFCVNEHVLVPRQDTEILVESVLDVLEPGMKVLDMCTGSGCILISLLKHSQPEGCQPVCSQFKNRQSACGQLAIDENNVSGVGVDVSEEALQVARKNRDKIGVQAELIQSDLFENVSGRYDIIVSNPPYIRTAVIEELKEEVKFHDPFLALDGKEDGLYFYRKIVEKSPEFLNQGGKLCFEIGHDQGEVVKRLMEEAGFVGVTIKKDLAGLDRVVFGKYNMKEKF
ncbi:MAG: peptide chain release factor N(5)-glutamine methyltransferase [Tyzzerella sp.]|nr:peptide chain release factor N(5)-glutamine methyltransferase [Tyzzerella sp.]